MRGGATGAPCAGVPRAATATESRSPGLERVSWCDACKNKRGACKYTPAGRANAHQGAAAGAENRHQGVAAAASHKMAVTRDQAGQPTKKLTSALCPVEYAPSRRPTHTNVTRQGDYEE
jgi:hypothetical protein